MSLVMDIIVENERERIGDAIKKSKDYLYSEEHSSEFRYGWLEALEFIKKELLGEEDEG